MVEDGNAKLDNAGEFALEEYREDTGSGWWDMGMVNILAATKALAAAHEAHALSIDPHAVDTMINKLAGMRDQLTTAATKASRIESSTPLGSGYAEQVGRINQQLGREVLTQVIPKLSQAIKNLEAEIHKSRASYQNVDLAHADTMDNIRGRTEP